MIYFMSTTQYLERESGRRGQELWKSGQEEARALFLGERTSTTARQLYGSVKVVILDAYFKLSNFRFPKEYYWCKANMFFYYPNLWFSPFTNKKQR